MFDVAWRLALLGVGAAIFQAPNNRAIMNVIPDKKKGVASSIIVTMRNLGMVFGVSIAGILLYTTISPELLEQNQLFNLAAYDFTNGMHLIMLLGAFLSILMLILSPVGIYKRKITETKEMIQESDIIPAPQEIIEGSSEMIKDSELVKYSKELFGDSELIKYSKEIIEDPTVLKRPKDILKEKFEELSLDISKKKGK
jgi:MFS family permease